MRLHIHRLLRTEKFQTQQGEKSLQHYECRSYIDGEPCGPTGFGVSYDTDMLGKIETDGHVTTVWVRD